MKSVSIIGYGFVGSAMGSLCERNNVNFNVYDITAKNIPNYFNSLENLIEASENINNTNYIFVCVPTPIADDGSCDTSIVESVLSDLSRICKKDTCAIIKSTVVPKTCRKFHKDYPSLDIVFCPEFLREVTYKEDIYNAEFILLGLPGKYTDTKYTALVNVFRTLYAHNWQIAVLYRSYEECEMFKYCLNTYLAVKISYFNKVFDVCKKIGVDYSRLRELFALDKRIGDYGTIVPGPDRKRGFGGHCLIKETSGMIKFLEELELDNTILKNILDENTLLRKL
jgi:UDPglucose 6-dehydrogenase